jgi:cytochrome c-type biogenesis protein CcmH
MMATIARILLVCLLSLSAGTAARAVNPGEVLDDPALEERARDISANLRCLVCQNQSIDDSDAELARDLRVIVRERLVAGDSNTEIFDFVVDRYGEFVLLRPRLSAQNLLLWGTPFAVLILGAIAVFAVARTRRRNVAALTDDEQLRLSKILADGEERDL